MINSIENPRWRSAATRDGKPVGDVPEKNVCILVAASHGWDVGVFNGKMFIGAAGVAGWQCVMLWQELPTLDVDEEGNLELPF